MRRARHHARRRRARRRSPPSSGAAGRADRCAVKAMKSGVISSALTHGAAGDEEGQAAIDGERAQRHHDRGNIELPDEEAVEGAEQRGRAAGAERSAAAPARPGTPALTSATHHAARARRSRPSRGRSSGSGSPPSAPSARIIRMDVSLKTLSRLAGLREAAARGTRPATSSDEDDAERQPDLAGFRAAWFMPPASSAMPTAATHQRLGRQVLVVERRRPCAPSRITTTRSRHAHDFGQFRRDHDDREPFGDQARP